MRAALFLLLAPLAASAVETRLTDSASRYAAMMEQSPFALATVVEAPKEPTEVFTANWVLTGLARLKNEKGEEKDYVTVRSRDNRLSFTLAGDQEATEDDAKGVSILSIDRQDGSRKSTVMLKRGSETGKVEFSQEAAPAAGAAPVNAGAMSANQVRALQMQQMQAQQARVQQMQNALTYGVNKANGNPINVVGGTTPNLGATLNVGANGQPRPVNGVFGPGVNQGVTTTTVNGITTTVPNGAGGAINWGGTGVVPPGNVTGAVPDSTDPRRRLRVINTR